MAKRKLVAIHEINDGDKVVAPDDEFTSGNHEVLVARGAAKYATKQVKEGDEGDSGAGSEDPKV